MKCPHPCQAWHHTADLHLSLTQTTGFYLLLFSSILLQAKAWLPWSFKETVVVKLSSSLHSSPFLRPFICETDHTAQFSLCICGAPELIFTYGAGRIVFFSFCIQMSIWPTTIFWHSTVFYWIACAVLLKINQQHIWSISRCNSAQMTSFSSFYQHQAVLVVVALWVPRSDTPCLGFFFFLGSLHFVYHRNRFLFSSKKENVCWDINFYYVGCIAGAGEIWGVPRFHSSPLSCSWKIPPGQLLWHKSVSVFCSIS